MTVQQGMITLSGITKQRKRAISNLHTKRENKMKRICSHNYFCAKDKTLAEFLQYEKTHPSKTH